MPELPAKPVARLWLAIGLLWLISVMVLSLAPVSESDGEDNWLYWLVVMLGQFGINDKWSHLLTYLFLGSWFSMLVLQRSRLLWVVFGLALYGLVIEALQSFTSHRTAEWGDMAANLAGILLSIVLYSTPLHRRVRKLVSV